MARASHNANLRAAFEKHLEETRGQIERIDQVVESRGVKLKRIKCVAMEGLVEDGQEQIEDFDEGPIRDAALSGAVQKVEHYEIATYGTLATLADQLGFKDVSKLLLETLTEEKFTDDKLIQLLKAEVSKEALSASM